MSLKSFGQAETSKTNLLWTLAIWKADENGEIQREIIWTGKKGSAPDLITMSQIVPPSLQPMQITDLSIQVLQQAPAQTVSTLLTMLACCASRRMVKPPVENSSTSQTMALIDTSIFQQLAQTSKKPTCGRVFKKGDIVWQCRQCGKDIACVQCDPCFRKSNHVGHEVYFHRSSGGSGCCDCGDPEAWLQEGNCCDHSPLVDVETNKSSSTYKSANQFVDEDEDPSSFGIPDVLKFNFRAVMDGIAGFMSTYVICQVRGFCSSIARSPYLSLLSDESEIVDDNDGEEFQLIVHNDDVHTYDEVMGLLRKLPIPSDDINKSKVLMDVNTAREYTIRIDKEGSQVILSAKISRLDIMLLSDENRNESKSGSNLALFEEYFRILHVEGGLHVSFAPSKINDLDANVVQATRWLVSVGDAAPGLRRLATRSLLVPIHPTSQQQTQPKLQQNIAYQAAIWMPSELPKESASKENECDDDEEEDDDEGNPFASLNAFDMTHGDTDEGCDFNIYPNEIPGLIDVETSYLHLSAGMSGALMQMSSLETKQSFDVKDGAEFEREAKARIRFPFLFLEKVPLSLCVMAHPFLTKSLQNVWNDLIIRYQYDLLFKAAFAQTTTVLYPSLMILFAKYRGVGKDTILRNTVQIYTANTAVESMSSQCLGLLNQNSTANLTLVRPLLEPKEALFITNMLSISLIVLMEIADLKRAVSYNNLPDHRPFLHKKMIQQRRYGQVCRDLEYTSASPSYCLRVLQGSTNPGTVNLWVDLCEALSFLDSYSRLTHAHIEVEDERWQSAMNLMLELESITTHFISCAFLSQLDCNPGFYSPAGAVSQVVKKDKSCSTGSISASGFDYHENLLIMSRTNQILLRASKNTVYYRSSLHQQAFVHTTHSVLSRLAEWSVKFFDEVETVGVALMQTVIYVPKLVVSKSPVSIHLPLHRMLSKCVAAAIQAGESNFVNDDERSGALSLQECFRSLHRLLVGHRLYRASAAMRLFQYDPRVFHDLDDSLVDACAKMGDDENTVLLLMEAPLMALVFAAQVRQGLWRRNGAPVANLAYNYSIPSLSKYYREPDYWFLQTMVTIGILSELESGRLSLFGVQTTSESMNRLTSVAFQRFLSLVTHRFELSGVLEAFRRVSLLPEDHPQRVQLQQLDETIFLFFSEYLKFICQFFTEIPTSYTKWFSSDLINSSAEQWSTLSDVEKMKLYMSHNGLMAAVMKEIVHQVLGGSVSLTQISKVKYLIGSPQRTVSDRLLTEALAMTCNIVGDSSDGSQSLSLKDAAYQLYDAEYVNLSSSQATTAFDRVKDRLKQTKTLYSDSSSSGIFYLPNKAPMNPYLPVIFPLSIPELRLSTALTADESLPENIFHLVRSQLFSPYFGEMMFRWMTVAQAAKTNQITLVGRIVQLLTLQIHCRPRVVNKNENVSEAHEIDWLTNYDSLSVYHLPLIRLLVPYFTDKTLLAESEPFYHEGLGFVLYEIGFRNEIVRGELLSLGFSINYFEQNKEVKPKTAKKKKTSESTGAKLTAQQKALEKMKNAASLFATSNTTKKPKNEVASSEIVNEENMTKANPFEGIEDSDEEQEEEDVCILCKEKKENSPKGFLCFVQSSALAKHFLLQDISKQQPLFKRKYLVVSLYGCNVYDDFRLFSDDSSKNAAKILYHLNYGQQVVAFSDDSNHESPGFSHRYEEESGRRGDCWLFITQPVIGWVQLYVSTYTLCAKLASEDTDGIEKVAICNKYVGQISEEDMSMGTATSSQLQQAIQPYNTGVVKSIFTRKIVTQLTLVSEFSFLQGNGSGGEKLHVSSCGHAMHYSCYDDFYSANYARSLNQQVNDSFWIDIEKGECLCPLCKSISNTLLPCSATNRKKVNESAASDHLAMDVDQDHHDADHHNPLQVVFGGTTVVADKLLSAVLMSRRKEAIHKDDHNQIDVDRRFFDFLSTNAFFCNSSSAVMQDISVATIDGQEETFGVRDVDNWFDGRMGLIKGISLTVQCTAYSLLQQVIKYLRYPASSNSSDETPVQFSVAPQALESQSDIVSQLMLQHLLLRISQAKEINNEKDQNDTLTHFVIIPFLCQLLGRDTLLCLQDTGDNNMLNNCHFQSFKNMNRLCRVAAHLPWPAVHSSAILPDPPSVLHILHSLQKQYHTQYLQRNSINKPVLPDNTWHFCAKPLLQSDLTCSLVTSMMCFTNESERRDVFLLLILAKIAQALLDPEALRLAQKRFSVEKEMSPVSTHVAKKAKLTHDSLSYEDNVVSNNDIQLLGESLLQMQNILMDSIGYQSISHENETAQEESAEQGVVLTRYVLSSLVVFVECVVRATAATQGLSAAQLRDKCAKECKDPLVLIPATNTENKNGETQTLWYTVDEVYRYINVLLSNILKMPLLTDILCLQNKEMSKGVHQWFVVWGNEMRDFFSVNFNDKNDENSATTTTAKMDIDEEKNAERLISSVGSTVSGKSTPLPATENIVQQNESFNNDGNNTNNESDAVVERSNPFLIDADEEFEDLDALNDVENNRNNGDVNTDNDTPINQLVRQVTMDDLRTFLTSFARDNDAANNPPSINLAVQHLVRQSQTANEDLRRVRSEIRQVEVQLGIITDTDGDANNVNANNGENANNTDNGTITATDRNNETATTWQEAQQLNATRVSRLQVLRDERIALIRQLTFSTSLLMMLMAANDRNVSIAQILRGEVNIQLAPAPNQDNANLNNVNLDEMFPSDMFNRDTSASIVDSQGHKVDNAPAAVSGRSLWPLYGVDPCNAFLLQRPNATNLKNENNNVAEACLDFVESLLIRNHRFCHRSVEDNEEVLLSGVDDLSHFPLRLDMFHPVVISPPSSHKEQRSATGRVEEVRQPVRSFVALPSLYTDLYTMCKFPKRLKMNKLPKVSQPQPSVNHRDTAVSETVADMVLREAEQGGDTEVEEEEVDQGGADEEEADEEFFNGDSSGVATRRNNDTNNRNRFKKQMSLRDPCICLICGKLLAAAQKVPKLPLSLSLDMANIFEQHLPGECTLHAMECSAGVGVFYLVSSCQTLLCRGGRAITSPSIYVDIVTGEAAQDRLFAGSAGLSGGENRPMFLSEKRLRKIEEWYLSHSVAKEVTRKRQGEKSVIRLNWF